MVGPSDVATQVLRLEQQLDAYAKLHAEEISELRQALNACKRQIAALSADTSQRPTAIDAAKAEEADSEGR